MFAAAVALALLAQPAIRLESDGSGQFVRATNGAGNSLRVYIDSGIDVPPLLGTSVDQGQDVLFRPRFPLQPGVRYRAVLDSQPPVSAVFELRGSAATPASFVAQIYPSADQLPENQLKFYIHFSAPMSRGDVYRWIHLLEDGREVKYAFLQLDEELWDPELKRFTLLFDPGRVKRDLEPNRELGAPLRVGKSYTLVIDKNWPDASGQTLRETHHKHFRVTSADRLSPDPQQWRVAIPPPSSRAPLAVQFPEPMDQALLLRMIAVLDPGGRAVDGSVVVDRGETRWQFTPAATWQSGAYSLRVDTALEDLAGNKIGRAFDVDLSEQPASRIDAGTITIPFRVAGSAGGK